MSVQHQLCRCHQWQKLCSFSGIRVSENNTQSAATLWWASTRCALWHSKKPAPVLQQHEAALKSAPPQLLLDAHLNRRRVHRQRQQDHAGCNGPVVVMNPPRPDAAAIHLSISIVCSVVDGIPQDQVLTVGRIFVIGWVKSQHPLKLRLLCISRKTRNTQGGRVGQSL